MIEAVLAGLIGLVVGSFLNVCIYRMPRDLSVVRPRSYCPECKQTLTWYDNIPLVSFVLLGGRCRRCGKAISLRYPAVELITGGLFFWAALSYGLTPATGKFCVFSALLIGLIFSDLEQRILPDQFTIGGVLAGIVLAALVPFDGFAGMFLPWGWGRTARSVAEAVVGAALAGGMLWLVGVMYQKVRHRDGLGFGDVKMVAMIGAFLGLYGAVLTLVIGSVLGSVLGLAYVLIARKKISTYELPFGTFLGVAALLVPLLPDPMASFLRQRPG